MFVMIPCVTSQFSMRRTVSREGLGVEKDRSFAPTDQNESFNNLVPKERFQFLKFSEISNSSFSLSVLLVWDKYDILIK